LVEGILRGVLGGARDLPALVGEPALEHRPAVPFLEPAEERHQADERTRQGEHQLRADLHRRAAPQCTPASPRRLGETPRARIEVPAREELGSSRSMVEIDPVCGMKVDPDRGPPTCVHEGRTYYFCAPGCLARFRAEPQRYLEKAAPVAARDAVYTCPMHPE